MENAFDPQINALGEALDINLLEAVERHENVINEGNRPEEAAKVISGRPNYFLSIFLQEMTELKGSSGLFYSLPPSTKRDVITNELTRLGKRAGQTRVHQFYNMLLDIRISEESETLLGTEQLSLLQSLLEELVRQGLSESECCWIYRTARNNVLDEMVTEMMNKVKKSTRIEDRITEWIKALRISVKSLFPGERKLCSQVLKGFGNSLHEQCFMEVTSSSLARLLDLGTEVPTMEISAGNLCLILNMFAAMCELQSTLEILASSKKSSSKFKAIKMLRDWLGSTAMEIFSKELEITSKNGGTHDSQMMATEDGGIHDLSIRVVKNLKDFISYQAILKQHLLQYKPGEDGLQFAPSCLQIMQVYQRKLEALAKCYKDPGQSYLFLMNNIHHMVISLKGIEGVPELLGEDWMSKQSRAAETNGELYRITCWGQVLERISGDLTAAVKKNAAKKRFKSFNGLLEEQLRKQRQWKVNDSELRHNLCTSVAAIVVAAYRLFYEHFRTVIEESASTCMKYTPEEVEKMLLERLFDRTETPG